MKLTSDYTILGSRVAEQVTVRPANGPTEEIQVDFFKDPRPAPPTHQPKYTKTNLEGPYKPPQSKSPQVNKSQSGDTNPPDQSPTQMIPTNRPGDTVNRI